jgi:hypothetical protein
MAPDGQEIRGCWLGDTVSQPRNLPKGGQRCPPFLPICGGDLDSDLKWYCRWCRSIAGLRASYRVRAQLDFPAFFELITGRLSLP